MTLPASFTRIKSDALIRENATPNGLTQNVVGSTGSCKNINDWYARDGSKGMVMSYPQSDMSSYSLIETVLAKDAECCRKTPLQICTLFILVIKLWRLGKFGCVKP